MKRLSIDESKYSLESRLELASASGNVRGLIERFNHGISRLAEELNKYLFAKTHVCGLTYFATQTKAFIFLNIRQDFLSLKFYTGKSSIAGLKKANWIQGGDKSGSSTFRITNDTTLEKALDFAKQSLMITSNLFGT